MEAITMNEQYNGFDEEVLLHNYIPKNTVFFPRRVSDTNSRRLT